MGILLIKAHGCAIHMPTEAIQVNYNYSRPRALKLAEGGFSYLQKTNNK